MLPGQFLNELLRLADIVQRQFAGFDEVRHYGLRPSAEKLQQVVNQTAATLFAA
jgi:hypothetical protein